MRGVEYSHQLITLVDLKVTKTPIVCQEIGQKLTKNS